MVVPLATGLGDGLAAAGDGLAATGDGFAATGDGLADAVDGEVLPQAAASKAATAMALVKSDFGFIWMLLNGLLPAMHPDTRTGYERFGYSGVTYAALRPPSTRNVAPFT